MSTPRTLPLTRAQLAQFLKTPDLIRAFEALWEDVLTMDHGQLLGLDDDDHTQYFNETRGDARYQLLDSDLTAIAALATTAFGRALLTLADAAAFTALANVATSALKGLAPASGGGTTNFLRADMTWAAPGSGGGNLDDILAIEALL